MTDPALAKVQAPVVVACNAPYGSGGMGRHLLEIVQFFRSRDIEVTYFDAIPSPALNLLRRFTPLRFSPPWQVHLESIHFDKSVARRLPKAGTFIGFNGQSLLSLRRAVALGYRSKLLAAAMLHVNFVTAQDRKAWQYSPVEPLGYIRQRQERSFREYEDADAILCATELTKTTFASEGVPREKLWRFQYSPHPRYTRPAKRENDSSFRIVMVGSLTIAKGVAVMLDAFEKLNAQKSELVLVGGSGTRQMRRFLQNRVAQDARIKIAPGDPLPHLQTAHVCVHPSFHDGFGYAPMEALACGTPVIVSETTGMKEFVRDGVNGFILPAGDPRALVDALERVRAGALAGYRI